MKSGGRTRNECGPLASLDECLRLCNFEDVCYHEFKYIRIFILPLVHGSLQRVLKQPLIAKSEASTVARNLAIMDDVNNSRWNPNWFVHASA